MTKPRFPRLLLLLRSAPVALAFVLPLVAGCAGEDAEAGPAAYPEPIGYTPPGQLAAAAPGPAAPQSPPSPPALRPGAPGWEDGSGSGEVAIGADGEPDDGTGTGAIGPGGASAPDGYSDADPSALTDFQSTLSPYGTWTDDPTYGTVWVPSSSVVGTDFTPYVSAGRWTYDDDYTWVSDYDWGWAPFHYGRWVYASGPGWAWIPGRQYAGAWVSWRYGVDDWAYVGWAPLPPTWCWHRGVAVGIGFVPRAPYAFVGTGEVFAPRIGARVIVGAQVGAIAAHTRAYVPSSSVVGGRVMAHPAVGGPSPASLRIAASSVVRAPVDNRGLAQARSFARPGTAESMGGHAPMAVAARAPAGAYRSGFAAAPTTSAPFEPSHFGGRMGGGFTGSSAAAAPARASAYTPYGGTRTLGAGGYAARPSYGGATAATRSPAYTGGGYRGGGIPGGGYRAAPSVGGFAPTRSFSSGGSGGNAPARSVGSVGGGFHGSGGGGFHGGGGGHSGHR